MVAAANVETVFSGAGKFVEEAPSTGPAMLKRVVSLHYNWKHSPSFIQRSTRSLSATTRSGLVARRQET